MEIGKKYKTLHTGSEELVVVEVLNERQFVVEQPNSGRRILASQDLHSGPHLSFAHISNEQTEMTSIQTERLWND